LGLREAFNGIFRSSLSTSHCCSHYGSFYGSHRSSHYGSHRPMSMVAQSRLPPAVGATAPRWHLSVALGFAMGSASGFARSTARIARKPLVTWRSGGTASLTSICRCRALSNSPQSPGARGSDRRVSLAVALLIFAFWLDRPAAW